MQAVNLLPRDLVAGDSKRLNLPILFSALVPVISVGLVVHGYGGARAQVDTAITELSISTTSQIGEDAYESTPVIR